MRFLYSLVFLISISANAQVQVKNLLTENLTNPVGLDATEPRFSWQLVSEKRNVMQTAYEIRVADESLKPGSAWTSGKIASDESVLVLYKGKALQSGKKYSWQVRVWDNSGAASAWSESANWQMGLLTPADWKASWIETGKNWDTVGGVSPTFRKTFSAAKKIKSATAFITSHGMYEAELNGKRVGNFYLTPGWTSYNKRLQYQVYDVTPLLINGKNAIGVTLGSGWYRTPLAWENNKNLYGKTVALLMQVEIVYADGSRETVVTDASWKSSDSPVIKSELYDGETYDAGKEKKGWSTAAYDDNIWTPAVVKDYPKETLVATYNEPVKKHEVYKALRIITTPKGEKVIDFGQNLVGWAQVRFKGPAGTKLKIDHAEVLDKFGNFYTTNLRAAEASNTFIAGNNGEQVFEPHFTFQGFRYIRIEGLPGNPDLADFTAVTLYSDMKQRGNFTSSNALINQLQHNIQWGQKGNFLDVPTDCPQRDERLGWTGDAQAFFRTATFNMQVHNFFAKWLKDVAADQFPSGAVPHVIPHILNPTDGGSAGWADVSTIIPWTLYQVYGDKRVLEQQYPSMQAWVGYMKNNSTANLWNKGGHFGDWLFYRPDDDNSGQAAITDKYLIAQCFDAYSTQLTLNAATVLGKTSDVQMYTAQLKDIKDAFLKEYVTPNGRMVSGSQTAYVLALHFDMLPENLRAQAAQRLVDNIKQYGNHLTTGFLGTPYLCHVLTRFGFIDVAYKLLMQESYPSWLYPVKMGATTIWERWDGQKPDSTFQTPGMNSFNHYAYGAIGDWMYRTITGINFQEGSIGYKKILIKPYPDGPLSSAKADFDTYYGSIGVDWKKEGKLLTLDIEIPVNTTAIVYVPAKDGTKVKEAGKDLEGSSSFKSQPRKDGYLPVELGSGKYHFTVE